MVMDGFISAVIGLVAGFIGAAGKGWLDRRTRIDDGLFTKRTELYAELWQMTGRIPKYPRDTKFTYGAVATLMVDLRTWYFEKSGGLYMSVNTQRHYIHFQSVLNDITASQDAKAIVEDKQYDAAQASASLLRSAMTKDLDSRVALRGV
jgi:hypothetical protein